MFPYLKKGVPSVLPILLNHYKPQPTPRTSLARSIVRSISVTCAMMGRELDARRRTDSEAIPRSRSVGKTMMAAASRLATLWKLALFRMPDALSKDPITLGKAYAECNTRHSELHTWHKSPMLSVFYRALGKPRVSRSVGTVWRRGWGFPFRIPLDSIFLPGSFIHRVAVVAPFLQISRTGDCGQFTG